MATRKSSIGAELVIDRRKFKAALDASRGDAAKFASGLEAIKAPRTGALAGDSWGSGLKGVIGKYQHLRSVVTDVAGLAIRTAGAPAMYNDMADSLKAVTGSAEEAGQALDFLAGVAEEQKLEFEPLVEAYEHMRALGYSAEQTRDFIREMGNAIETSGGDASDLTAVAGALEKIKDKGELTAKALGQMGKSMPFLRTILKEQFGVETGAEIEALNLSMEELFDGIMRGLRRVETNKGGKLDAMSPEYLASMSRLRAGRAGTGSSPTIPDLPERVAEAADPGGDARRIDARRAREKAKVDAAAAEKQAKADAASAAKSEKERAAEDKALAEKEAAQGKFLADAEGQNEVARLRSRGKSKQADKLEKELAEKARIEQLMTEGGLRESDAAKMAKGERRIAEDEDYRSRTGRNRIHGGVSDNTYGGLDARKFSDREMGMKDEWNFDALDAAKAGQRRPLKSQRDREAGKASITPDRMSGMSQKQADEMLEVMRAIRAATEKNAPTVADKTSPRT